MIGRTLYGESRTASEVGLRSRYMGLYWFRPFVGFVACVIQWPQSDIQRHLVSGIDTETMIEIEMAGLDAEYEALVAEHSVVLA